MKSIGAKKVIVIFTVLITIVVAAVVVAFVTGNTRVPSLTDPDGVFYTRYDDAGNAVYTITNQELFEKIKANDGVDQTLYLIDSYLLKDYLDNLTDEQIQARITEETYGTSDPDEIAALDADTRASYEEAFAQAMLLAGYKDNEEAYVSILLAREIYARYIIDLDKEITDLAVAKEYVNSYFEDIKALRIRFMSSAEAKAALQEVNLLTYNASTLREYLGYVYKDETLKQHNNANAIVEAYTTIDTYYFDVLGNISNLDDEIVYTIGENDIYTDEDDNEYSLDANGNLVDVSLTVIVANNLIYDTKAEATTYKNANTYYYDVTKVDPFDQNEDAKIESDGFVLYTVDSDGKIYDMDLNDVTDTTDMIVNKTFAPIEDVTLTTLNNSSELTNEEVLAKFILIYNSIYGGFRDPIAENSTAADLIASGNEYLDFNYDDVYATQTSLATYMFKTLDLSLDDAIPYSPAARSYAGSNDNNYYLVYKLEQVDKVTLYSDMADLVAESIVLPESTVDNLTLPTTGFYSAKITWSSSDTDVIKTDGTVTLPAEPTTVTLSLSISINGVANVRTKEVTVLPSGGTTSEVTESTVTEIPVKTLMNDDALFDTLYNQLVDDMVYGSSGDTNVSDKMIALRQEYNFDINDYYLALEYGDTDSDFVFNDKGDKHILATVSGRPGDEEAAFDVTADDFMDYVMAKNPGLYIIYASQLKELIYSTYYTDIFGTVTNLEKNKSDKMAEMYAQVNNAKDYYVYLANAYAQYGLTLPYKSFSDYAYLQYNTKTEADLLAYFVQGVLQPYFIDEAISAYDLVDLFYPTVQDYYDNYFSLNVTHLLIYVDFDEDGTSDSYNDYVAGLDAQAASDFESLIAQLETAIDDYDDTFAKTVTAYQDAAIDDPTWGVFKQAGIWMLWQDLNQEDSDGVSHSNTYSGEYGVKDSYVPEFTSKLVSMYDEYVLPQNLSLDSMMGTVATDFGYHILNVTKGDDFVKPSAEFTEEDPANPVYSVGSENASGMPTLAQLELYTKYYFYSIAYDLSDAAVEETYGITVPNIPATVSSAINTYYDALLAGVYVVGTINIEVADYLVDGEFQATTYSTLTDAQVMALLSEVHDVYYAALFGQYED